MTPGRRAAALVPLGPCGLLGGAERVPPPPGCEGVVLRRSAAEEQPPGRRGGPFIHGVNRDSPARVLVLVHVVRASMLCKHAVLATNY